jgi:hypothetical protein
VSSQIQESDRPDAISVFDTGAMKLIDLTRVTLPKSRADVKCEVTSQLEITC